MRKYKVTFNGTTEKPSWFNVVEASNFYETDTHVVFFEVGDDEGQDINTYLIKTTDIRDIRPFFE